MSFAQFIQAYMNKMKIDKIGREDLPKLLCLYQEFQDSKQEVVKPGSSKARTSPDDTSSDEEIDILTVSENENSNCHSSIISEDCNDTQRLKSTSSCTHTGEELEKSRENLEVVKPRSSKTRGSPDYTDCDEEVDILTVSDDNLNCESSTSKDCSNIQGLKSPSSFIHTNKEAESSKRNLKICRERTRKARKRADDTSSDEETDSITFSNDDDESSEDSTSKTYTGNQFRCSSSNSSSSFTIHVCTYEGCDKFFSRPSRLAQHLRTHTGERPFVCPSKSCTRSYTRQQHLSRHIQTSHQDERPEEKLECVLCKKMMSNVWNLRKHVQRIHARKNHDCNVCGMSFSKQQHLQTHSYVHTGIQPYPCDYPDCEMRFINPSKLKRHKLIHQKGRYACPQESCQQKFDAYKDLRQHIATSHPKVCDICSRPFRHLRVLKKHRLTHESTVQAYFCTYEACNKFYYHARNLVTHVKEKHQQQCIYQCGVCDKRFSTKQKLIHHMNTHSASYKRNHASKKPRSIRKDKGCIRRDLASLLSGYNGDREEESLIQTVQQEANSENNSYASTSGEVPLSP